MIQDNLSMKEKRLIENRLMVGMVGGGKDWEFGISKCKLLYIGWINSKDRLYTTGNSTY